MLHSENGLGEASAMFLARMATVSAQVKHPSQNANSEIFPGNRYSTFCRYPLWRYAFYVLESIS